MHDISLPPAPKLDAMGPEPNKWCKFHKLKGLHTWIFYQLKEMEHLIQENHLKKYVISDVTQTLGSS